MTLSLIHIFKEKEMSKGELTSVMQAVGGIDKLLNPKAKDEEQMCIRDRA